MGQTVQTQILEEQSKLGLHFKQSILHLLHELPKTRPFCLHFKMITARVSNIRLFRMSSVFPTEYLPQYCHYSCYVCLCEHEHRNPHTPSLQRRVYPARHLTYTILPCRNSMPEREETIMQCGNIACIQTEPLLKKTCLLTKLLSSHCLINVKTSMHYIKKNVLRKATH